MKIDPNGPVFPHHGSGMFGEPITHVPGMTYRQWLVGTIAAGYISDSRFVGEAEQVGTLHDLNGKQVIARCSVAMADAVIAELNREESR